MNKIKVTVIMGPFLPVPPVDGGAVEKLWFDLCKELVSDNIEITQISKHYDGFLDNEIIDNVKHVRVKGYDSVNSHFKRLFLDFLYAFRAINMAKKSDIIITNSFWAPVLGKILTKSKIWVSAHRFPKKQYFLYKNVDLIQPVSNSVAKGIIEQEPTVKNLVKVLPNFIKLDKNKIHLSDKKKIILFVGRIHPEKGVQYLIKAFNKINEVDKLGWELRIVGPHEEKFGGGGDEYLKSLIDLSIKNTTFVGSIFDKEELNNEYKKASIFVYPSIADGEAFGLAPLEAMALGCQTIVSELECYSDFLKNKNNGFIYIHDEEASTLSKLMLEAINRHSSKEHEEIFNTAIETAVKFEIKSVSKLFEKEILRLYNEA